MTEDHPWHLKYLMCCGTQWLLQFCINSAFSEMCQRCHWWIKFCYVVGFFYFHIWHHAFRFGVKCMRCPQNCIALLVISSELKSCLSWCIKLKVCKIPLSLNASLPSRKLFMKLQFLVNCRCILSYYLLLTKSFLAILHCCSVCATCHFSTE